MLAFRWLRVTVVSLAENVMTLVGPTSLVLLTVKTVGHIQYSSDPDWTQILLQNELIQLTCLEFQGVPSEAPIVGLRWTPLQGKRV